MNTVLSITKKELRSYFNSPIAYVFLIIFIALSVFFAFLGFFIREEASVASFFQSLPWILILLVPALTMRLWAEERKLGTIELLMTLPVRTHQVVMGKFLASMMLLFYSLILTVGIPLSIGLIGPLDRGPVISGYIGTLLLGAAYLSIGLFLSSVTSDQIIAFILTGVVILALFIVGTFIALLPAWLVPVAEAISLSTHFDSIARGVIDVRDVVYYLSVTVFFLILNIGTLEAKKW